MMKRVKWLGVGVFFFSSIILNVFVANVSADIQGSVHDFSNDNWNRSREVCVVCHTPHRAEVNAQVPLWNHQTTLATFSLYQSPTLNATVSQPDGASKACLSCHDGTVALDAFGGAINNIGQGQGEHIIGSDLIGIDLANDHPISFVYDAALATADRELATPQSASTVDGVVPLFASKVQCSTCHDVHNTANQTKLLVKSNAGSALCLTCHVK
ncbi:MAG: cytochrome c3 family protein [Candidatus Omnitrophica bacterium]|nr:cytochrome c3 family protein [Candidatus Omnitrophota bacterium]